MTIVRKAINANPNPAPTTPLAAIKDIAFQATAEIRAPIQKRTTPLKRTGLQPVLSIL